MSLNAHRRHRRAHLAAYQAARPWRPNPPIQAKPNKGEEEPVRIPDVKSVCRLSSFRNPIAFRIGPVEKEHPGGASQGPGMPRIQDREPRGSSRLRLETEDPKNPTRVYRVRLSPIVSI